MHTLTVATHDEGYLVALKESCERFGYSLQVLGWQEPWQGFRWRMQLVVDALKKLPRDEIVMFVDAFDVVMTGPAEEAREVFLRSKAPMVVSAQREHVGVMGWAQKRSFETSSHLVGGHGCQKDCNSPFTLICAGTFIAYAGYAADLLHRCLADQSDCKDDQVLMNRVWNDALKNKNETTVPFKIDCGREIFNVHLPNIFSFHPRSIYSPDNAQFNADGRVVVRSDHNNAKETRPLVTHFSGGIQAADEIRRLGYSVKDDPSLKWYDVEKALYHIKNSLLSKQSATSTVLGDARASKTGETEKNHAFALYIALGSVCVALLVCLVVILRKIASLTANSTVGTTQNTDITKTNNAVVGQYVQGRDYYSTQR